MIEIQELLRNKAFNFKTKPQIDKKSKFPKFKALPIFLIQFEPQTFLINDKVTFI